MTDVTDAHCRMAIEREDGCLSATGDLRAHVCGLRDHHDGRDHRCASCGVWFRISAPQRVRIALGELVYAITLQWFYLLQRTVCRWRGHDLHITHYGMADCRRCGQGDMLGVDRG